MNFTRKYKILTFKNFLLSTTVAILSFLLYVYVTIDTFHISNNTGFAFYTYDDTKKNGNSKSEITVSPAGEIQHYCKLGTKRESPYCGFSAQLPNLEFFSASGKLIKADIYSDTICLLPVTIQIYLPGFTKKNVPESFLFLEKTVVLGKGLNNIEVSANEMTVPTWWYSINNITEQNLPEYNLEEASVLAFSNDQFLKPGSSRRLTFSNIRLQSNPSFALYGGLIVLVLSWTGIAIIYVIKNKKQKHVYIPIKPQKVDEKKDNTPEMIMECLSQEYHNSELRVKQIARKIGVSENKVSTVLKEHTGMTFSEYLNYIRIEEAKRQLQETNLSISEISSCIGYDYPQNFNRVFRKLTGLTPKEFRQKQCQIIASDK